MRKKSDSELVERVNKSAQKRIMNALQDMGERLTKLTKEQLAKIEMDEVLRAAIIESHRLTKREAKRRHLQYIGRLMRSVETEQIQQALDLLDASTATHNAHFHRIEKWRDRLIADASAFTRFLDEYPTADRQHLNQLMRNAQKEENTGKPPGAKRKLFQYLREVLES